MAKHIVYNRDLEVFANRYIFGRASVPVGANAEQDLIKLRALIFEQFLLFDKIAIKVDRWSSSLRVLLPILGINKFQELIEKGIIVPVMWTSDIFTSPGMKMEDGTFDYNSVIGKPPLISGQYHEDRDPEKNLETLFSYFPKISQERKRIITKRTRDKFVLLDGDFARRSVDIVIDAYKSNKLERLGLPALKEPEQLDFFERSKLAELGSDVLETSILAKKEYKSYDKYSYFHLTKDSLRKIESAFHVSENTTTILSLENIAAIQRLVSEEKISFERMFDIRYHDTVKHYRKWINTTSESVDAERISIEYINLIKGKNKFFESTGGKFLRNVLMLGVGTGVGTAVSSATDGIVGGMLGMGIGKAADLGLSLLDTYVLDGLLKGWNPSMFIDTIRYESEPPATLYTP